MWGWWIQKVGEKLNNPKVFILGNNINNVEKLLFMVLVASACSTTSTGSIRTEPNRDDEENLRAATLFIFPNIWQAQSVIVRPVIESWDFSPEHTTLDTNSIWLRWTRRGGGRGRTRTNGMKIDWLERSKGQWGQHTTLARRGDWSGEWRRGSTDVMRMEEMEWKEFLSTVNKIHSYFTF